MTLSPGGKHIFGTMYRDRSWKIIVYHGCPFDELYDIERDPNEFANLWDDSAHSNVKLQYLKESFDATVSATDTGPPLRQPDATRRP